MSTWEPGQRLTFERRFQGASGVQVAQGNRVNYVQGTHASGTKVNPVQPLVDQSVVNWFNQNQLALKNTDWGAVQEMYYIDPPPPSPSSSSSPSISPSPSPSPSPSLGQSVSASSSVSVSASSSVSTSVSTSPSAAPSISISASPSASSSASVSISQSVSPSVDPPP